MGEESNGHDPPPSLHVPSTYTERKGETAVDWFGFDK